VAAGRLLVPASQQAARILDGVGASTAAVTGRIDTEIISAALRAPNFSVPFRDLPRDAHKIRERVENLLIDAAKDPRARPRCRRGRLFRDRSAFIVGRWVLADDRIVPFVVAC